MDMRFFLGRRNYGQVKWCLFPGVPFFFFFSGVHRLARLLILCKTGRARPGGRGTRTGNGDSRQKRLQKQKVRCGAAAHVVPQ